MTSINNLKGSFVKDGKVVYSEKLEKNLYFVILVMYEPFYQGKNIAHHQNSSQLFCQALITTNNKHNWGNGIVSLDEAEFFEKVEINQEFKPLKENIKNINNFKIWQVAYNFKEYEDVNTKIKYKTRNVKWLIEVPKTEMFTLSNL